MPASAVVACAHAVESASGQGCFHAVLLVGHTGGRYRRAVRYGSVASDDGIVSRPDGRGRRSPRLHPARRGSADLLLPHECRVRVPWTDGRARAAHRRDRTHRCHDRASRALGAEGQRSAAKPARVLARGWLSPGGSGSRRRASLSRIGPATFCCSLANRGPLSFAMPAAVSPPSSQSYPPR